MRNSPSGSSVLSDELSSAVALDTTSLAAGEYFIPPFVETTPIQVSDPLVGLVPLISGVKTSRGQLVKARIGILGPIDTAGTQDFTLQWTVNAIPKGKVVTVKWDASVPDINSASLETIMKTLRGAPVDFGDVTWQPGDFVFLKAVFGYDNSYFAR
jgi:hypothetical protein